jgi:16S rRNA (uracil1498-N3)-methyltransferase
LQYLSDIELYYSNSAEDELITLSGEEFHHCAKVMRHSPGDEIYITDGRGKIFLTEILDVGRSSLNSRVKKILNYENHYSNIFFCIPKIKSGDRFEFALEKSTELGITNFLIFDSERVVHKSVKKERWGKILLSAMKQSLRSYLPEIKTVNSLNDILNFKGRKILLDQHSEKNITDLKLNEKEKSYFIFGPEGGFTKDEINLFTEKFKLAENRLRTETAVIKCASLILE